MSPSIEIMGEKIPAENLGNMYAAYSGKILEVPLKGCAVAALLFAALSLPFAGLYCCCLAPCVGRKKVDLSFAKVDLVTIFDVASLALYLVFLILGSVAAGMTASADGGLGLIKAGACPVLIIVFSIVFGIVCAACRLTDKLVILKNCPSVGKIDREPLEYSAPYPQQPQEVKKVSRAEAPAANDADVKRYLKLLYIEIITMCLPVAEAAILMSLDFSLYVLGYLLIAFFAACVIFILIKTPRKTSFKFYFAKIFWLDLVLWIGCGALFAMFYMDGFTDLFASEEYFYIGLSMLAVLLFLSRIVLWILERKAAKECRRLFYGTTKKSKCAELNGYGADFAARQEAYLKSVAEYSQYKKQMRAYRLAVRTFEFEKNMSERGYDCTGRGAKILRFVCTRKLLVFGAAAILIVGIMLAVILPAALAGEETALAMALNALLCAIK